jgi:hypothetical protein
LLSAYSTRVSSDIIPLEQALPKRILIFVRRQTKVRQRNDKTLIDVIAAGRRCRATKLTIARPADFFVTPACDGKSGFRKKSAAKATIKEKEINLGRKCITTASIN